MEWVDKISTAIFAVYGVMAVLAILLNPVREMVYWYIDYQTNWFVGLLIVAIIGKIVSKGAGGGGGGAKH